MVWQMVEELRGLMKDLPMYSREFLSILCDLLSSYRDSCYNMYRGTQTAYMHMYMYDVVQCRYPDCMCMYTCRCTHVHVGTQTAYDVHRLHAHIHVHL